VKDVGEPGAGEPHARFDGGELEKEPATAADHGGPRETRDLSPASPTAGHLASSLPDQPRTACRWRFRWSVRSLTSGRRVSTTTPSAVSTRRSSLADRELEHRTLATGQHIAVALAALAQSVSRVQRERSAAGT
jgi:hypothetical protein